MTFRAVLLQTIQRTADIFSFRFEPDTPCIFQPGQFIKVMFDEADAKNKNLNKYLSLSCAPGKPYIEVTKRLSASDFSNRLRNLQPGDAIAFTSPMGTFVIDSQVTDIGFLTGGIGITPAIAMLENIAEHNLPINAALIYANRDEHNIAFKDELDAWQNIHPGIHINYSTDARPEDPSIHHGLIDADYIRQVMPDFKQRQIYIFGPPVMVEIMQKICRGLGCADGMILIEKFAGY